MQELLRSTIAYSLLEREKNTGRLANAYLLVFADERNLRTALATFAPLFFARADERIAREIHPDCIFLPEVGKSLTVDDAEKIVEESVLSSVEGGNKLFVLDNMQKASAVVQNKLLKVLEEPPEGVYFLLGSTGEFPILPTVRSRTKRLDIPPFPVGKVEACLKRLYPMRRDVRECAEACDGVVGRAQDLLGDGKYEELEEKAFWCVSAGQADIPSAARALAGVAEKAETVSLIRRMYRDMLFYRTGQPYASGGKSGEKLRALSAEFTPRALVYALDVFAEAERQLVFNANLSQCVEVALWKIDKEKRK